MHEHTFFSRFLAPIFNVVPNFTVQSSHVNVYNHVFHQLYVHQNEQASCNFVCVYGLLSICIVEFVYNS